MSYCTPCTPGTYSQSGQEICIKCSGQTATSRSAAIACTKCESHAFPNVAKTACVCISGYYLTDYVEGSDAWNCNVCPEGADCQKPDQVWGSLLAKEGYWRESNNSGFQRCMVATHCPGGEALKEIYGEAIIMGGTTLCANHRGGLLCANCITGYKEVGGGVCEACPQNATGSLAGTVMAILLVVVLVISVFTVVLRSGAYLQRKQKVVDRRLVVMPAAERFSFSSPTIDQGETIADAMAAFVHEQALSEQELAEQALRESDLRMEQEEDLARALDEQIYEFDPYDKKYRVLITIHGPPLPPSNFVTKVKIIVGFGQICTTLGTSLQIVWPVTFQNFLTKFDFINMDALMKYVVATECIPGMNYYHKFLMTTLSPLVLCTACALLFVVPHRRKV